MKITIAASVLCLLSTTERGPAHGVASASLAPRARALSSKRHRKHAGAGVSSSAAWGRANDTMAAFTDDGESSSYDLEAVDYVPDEFAVSSFEPETMRVARNVLVLMLATVLLTGTAALSPVLSLSPAASARMRRDVVAGATIFSLGDLLAQLLTGARRLGRLDSQRLAVSTCLGAVWSGLCVPVVYTSAEGMFPGRSPARVLAKMAVTCSVLSTAGNYATMLARRWVQELLKPPPAASTDAAGRRSLGACVKSCNGDIGEVIMDDLKVWPLYDVACYALIPPSLRPITTAVMSSGWAMYMSVVSARTGVSAPPAALPSSSSGMMRNGTDSDGGERIRSLSRCAAA